MPGAIITGGGVAVDEVAIGVLAKTSSVQVIFS